MKNSRLVITLGAVTFLCMAFFVLMNSHSGHPFRISNNVDVDGSPHDAQTHNWSDQDKKWIEVAFGYIEQRKLDARSIAVESVAHEGVDVCVTFAEPKDAKSDNVVSTGASFAYKIYFKDGSKESPQVVFGN